MLFGTRMLKVSAWPAWHRVILYLSLGVIWFFLSRGIYSSQLNYLELRIMLFCQSGLVAIVYLGRHLLIRDARSPRFFKWVAGLFLFVFLGLKFTQGVIWTPVCPWISGIVIQPFSWPKLFLILFEGLITSVFVALFIEIIVSVYQCWCKLPRFAPDVTCQYWNRVGSENVKLGLLVTLGMILAYFYIINFLLADTVLYSYLLAIPVLSTGAGLFWVFAKKVSGWRDAEIQAIDRELAPLIAWEKYMKGNELAFKAESVVARVQYLQIIREYLRQMKQPHISWWVIVLYALFCGTILCLPYVLNVVIEA
jgi:hypothetical protein